MGEHAKLAPSAAHRWLACPGSIRLSEDIPDESSPYADEGTFAHSVAERALRTGKDALDFRGVRDGDFVVDVEMAGYIQVYLDAVRTLAGPLGAGHPLIETKVHYEPGGIWGTVDALHVAPPELHVVDLKFGRGVYVDPERNPQLMLYALGALRQVPRDEIDTVGLHVVQPRWYGDVPAWRSWETTPEELQAWAREHVDPTAESIEQGNDDLCAGEWCRFCPARTVCPELRRSTLEATQHLFADVEKLETIPEKPDASALSAEQLGRALQAIPIIEQWIKSVHEHAYERANKGEKIPGHKLVQKFGHRQWVGETDDVATKLIHLGIHDPYEKKVISPAKAEKKLPKAKHKQLGGIVHRPSIGTALVPHSDKRPEYDPKAVFLPDVER